MAGELATPTLAAPTDAPAGGTDVEATAPAAKPARAKAAKDGKGKAGKGAKAGKDMAPTPAGTRGPMLFLAEHPRAVRAIARTKAWGALAGFLVGGYLSLPTETLPAAGVRALAAGAICYLVAWAGAVFLWRRLVVAELRDAQQAEVARRLPTAAEPSGRRPRTPAGV